jgi:hypothetical protein
MPILRFYFSIGIGYDWRWFDVVHPNLRLKFVVVINLSSTPVNRIVGATTYDNESRFAGANGGSLVA